MNTRNIKEVRKELGMTQREFGKWLGYSDCEISRWETGNRVVPESVFMLIEARFAFLQITDLFNKTAEILLNWV